MDREEPEQGATAGGLPAAHVDDVAFSKPPIGRRGYHQDEVDAFLDVVAGRLETGRGAYPRPGSLPSARHGGTRHGEG